MGRRYHYKRLTIAQLNEKYVKKNKFLKRFMDGYPHNYEEKIGYCWNNTHKGYLTWDLLLRHQCLEKNCHYMQLYYEIEHTKNGPVLGKKKEMPNNAQKDTKNTTDNEIGGEEACQ